MDVKTFLSPTDGTADKTGHDDDEHEHQSNAQKLPACPGVGVSPELYSLSPEWSMHLCSVTFKLL